MKNIILKIIYHCKNDWFFRLWMSFYLNLLCMEGKMMMLLKNILYQSKIDLQSWWWCWGIHMLLSRAKPVRYFRFFLFPKFFAFSTRTTTYGCCFGDIYIPICSNKTGQWFNRAEHMKSFVNLRNNLNIILQEIYTCIRMKILLLEEMF